jgi:outer membrane protein OmpA-like peptidoglycan-associated protein
MVPRSYPHTLIIKLAVILLLGEIIIGKTTIAEESIIIGNHNGQRVETNFSVLNSLQGSPTLPDLLRGEKTENHDDVMNGKPSYFSAITSSPSKNRRLKPIELVDQKSSAHNTGVNERYTIPSKPLLKLSPSFFIQSNNRSQSVIKIPKKPVLIPVKVVPIINLNHAKKPLETKTEHSRETQSQKQKIANKESNTVKAQLQTKTNQVRVLFNSQEKTPLKAELLKLEKVINALASGHTQRIQLVAYASKSDSSASKARRLSLTRALSIRSYLINNGINSGKMSIKALGNKIENGPPNRVDIVLLK